MSHAPLLPQTVRIKRKRQDEPVDTLHVHTQEDSKRRRHTEDPRRRQQQQQQRQQRQQQHESPAQAVFRRVQDPKQPISGPAGLSSSSSVSHHCSLLSSSSSGPPPHSAAAITRLPAGGASGGSSRKGAGPTGSSSGRRILSTPQATRRFHLARGSQGSGSASSSTTGPAGGVGKKKRKNVATLVESKPKKRRSSDEISSAVADYVARRVREQSGQPWVHVAGQQQPSPLKRPGKSSAVSTPRKAHSATPSEAHLQQQTNANTPATGNGASAVDPGLLAEMQRFAQEVESADQQQFTEGTSYTNSFQQQQQQPPCTPSRPSTTSSPTPQKLKFQPKPTPRYRARNPAAVSSPSIAMEIDGKPSTTASSTDASDTSSSDSDEDGDYVYDTYILDSGPASVVLHNASTSAATAATMNSVPAQPLPPSVGLLIIRADDEPLWEAYADDDAAAAAGGADDGDDDAFDTDDEDSNAEDWRGNEYPEEEEDDDDSDVEVPAQRRPVKGLPVEDEEWDVRALSGAAAGDSDAVGGGWGSSGDDAVWSDEEEQRMRRPFSVPGWLKR